LSNQVAETHDTKVTAEFRREEERVEARGAAFKKELGLSDLVLTQILFIVGLPWVGVAAKQGPSHIILWLVAMFFFYVPSAVVVIYLNRLMPLEGGLYQWAKLGFNDLIGFMVAWNLWLFAIYSPILPDRCGERAGVGRGNGPSGLVSAGI
jgi:hypothetical protein